eukprot:4439676-Pleurochrysis_carterae.AAC.1
MQIGKLAQKQLEPRRLTLQPHDHQRDTARQPPQQATSPQILPCAQVAESLDHRNLEGMLFVRTTSLPSSRLNSTAMQLLSFAAFVLWPLCCKLAALTPTLSPRISEPFACKIASLPLHARASRPAFARTSQPCSHHPSAALAPDLAHPHRLCSHLPLPPSRPPANQAACPQKEPRPRSALSSTSSHCRPGASSYIPQGQALQHALPACMATPSIAVSAQGKEQPEQSLSRGARSLCAERNRGARGQRAAAARLREKPEGRYAARQRVAHLAHHATHVGERQQAAPSPARTRSRSGRWWD